MRREKRILPVVSAMAVAVVILIAGQAWAGSGIAFPPPNPQELQMTSEPLAPGAQAIILYRQVDRDDNVTTSHQDVYVRIKILTEEGRKYADVEIPYRKEYENIHGLRARSVRPDGTISDFQGKPFDKQIVKVKGLKYLAKTFTLPDVMVGSVIEYTYTTDFNEYLIFDSHWILSDDLFTKEAHFSLKPYESAYQRFNLRWSWHALPPGTGVPRQDNDHVVRLEVKNIPAFQTEDYMPPESELKSRVDFVYSEDNFESDEAKYWRNVVKKWNENLESFVNKRKAMEQAVSQIVSASDAPEVKLQKIYRRVQLIRNTSFEEEKTAQEQKRDKEKDNNNVEDLWKHGYGNGRDITWLFLGLARTAGFEAYGVWTSDRRNYFFSSKQMDKSKLDANVVLVKVNGKDQYFDPGAAFVPYGLLPWDETGVSGLRLDKDGGGWVLTTLPASAESKVERTAKLKLTDSGDLEGKVVLKFTGLEAWQRRVGERHVDETGRKEFLENQVKEYVPAAMEADLTNKPDWSSSEAPLVAEYSVKIPGWASGAGRRAMLGVGLFSASEKHVFDHTNRIHPIYFEYPFQKVDDVTIELPLGWSVSSLPAEQNKDGHVVSYTLKTTQEGGTLHWSRVLNVDVLLLDSKYYMALRNFFQVVRTGDEEQVVLQPGVASAAK